MFGGRRRGARRDGDLHATDWYEPRLLFVTAGIVLLSATDAALTLGLVRSGIVREANPLMRLLLEHDVQTFVGVKTLITGTAMIVLVPAAHVRILQRLHVRTVLDGLLGLYCALIVYELIMLAVVAGRLFG